MAQIVEFTGNHPILILAAVLLIALIIVNELRARLRGVTELTTAAAVAEINRGALVLDARAAEQYAEGHIINALNAPLDTLAGRLDTIRQQHAGRAVISYCGNGASGARAAQLLRANGFAPVFNLRGGLAAWQRDNLPVEKAGARGAGQRQPKRKRAGK
jgi:rhodanese-related sulfurtransferase